ncbi:MAG: coproporphyrinogen dehydrogenase HemZ [Lachnospiraceae bacterium]|nr:coproporphyrinogen dehydrogenase HemZ [Lachnospiraceae bacterium]
MKYIKLNEANFEYDIHSLVKAFYPREDIKVVVEEEKLEGNIPFLSIEYGQDEITIVVDDSSQNVKEASTKKEVPMGKEVSMGMKTFGEQESGIDNKNEKVISLEKELSRAEIKNCLKQGLYSLLSDITGKKLPWGTLTGIRPTKLAYQMLEEKTEPEILNHYKDVYLSSEEKAKLSIEIAKKEKEILSGIHYQDGYSLYIGIPFCPSTCLYCSFTSFPIVSWKKKVQEYLDCLIKEIEYTKEAFADKVLDSIYIGGGTPTTLEPEELDFLLSHVCTAFDMDSVKEFTVEAGRADSITREKLEVLKKYGVTRISVNPQTMKEETLHFIGRKATAAATIEAFHLAREVGFDNINMDLIMGLPGETKEDVMHTLEVVKELAPDSLTIHSLAIKRASALAQKIHQVGYDMLHNSEDIMEMCEYYARQMGMHPYYLYRQKNMSGNMENVGYALPGKEGIYNILIMEEVQTIIACGAGTVTKRVYGDGRIERCDNVKDVALYISKIEEMIDRKRQLFKD